MKALSKQGEQQSAVSREKSALWNMTRHSQLFNKLPNEEIQREFDTLKSLDLQDPLSAVDASVRFESFKKTALHALVPFQNRSRLLKRLEVLESRKKPIRPLPVEILYEDGTVVPYEVFAEWGESERERFGELHGVKENP